MKTIMEENKNDFEDIATVVDVYWDNNSEEFVLLFDKETQKTPANYCFG